MQIRERCVERTVWVFYLFLAGAAPLFGGLCALGWAIARGRSGDYLAALILIPLGSVTLVSWWRQAGKSGLPKVFDRLRPPKDPYDQP